MENLTRIVALALFLAVLGFLTFRVLSQLLEPIAWAVILVYATWPFQRWLRALLKGRDGWSAAVLTLSLGTLIAVPLIGLLTVLQRETVEFFRMMPAWLETRPNLPAWIERIPYFGSELRLIFDQFDDLQGLLRQYLLPWASGISTRALGMLEGAGSLAAKLLFTLFLMFFVYRDGEVLVREFRRGAILAFGKRAGAYIGTAETTIKAVVYGIVLTAIVQGFFAGLGYWGVGMNAPVLLSLVTMLVALIPFGTVAVWVSASLWLLAQGDRWAALSLFLWGALVVSWVDNLVRPWVISRTTRIPFVLVMLGVLGGLTGFGFIGLFIGPVILALALAVWREWLHGEQQGSHAG